MTREFSLSSNDLGIKNVDEFIKIDVEFLHGLIKADYGPIKERTLFVRYVCKGYEEWQRAEKEKLIYCLPTGLFNHRSIKGLADYSCYTCFDIDADLDIPAEAEYLEKVWEQLKACPLVVLQWHSVRGGIKFIVEHDSLDPSNHKNLMVCLVAELEKRGVDMEKVDKRCYDLSRAHYVSFDPDAILNDSSEVYHYIPTATAKPFTAKLTKQKRIAIEKILGKPRKYADEWSAIQSVQKESNERFPVVKGCRNINVFIFAVKLHDLGVSKEMAIQYLILRYSEDDFPASEIKKIVDNAYKYCL